MTLGLQDPTCLQDYQWSSGQNKQGFDENWVSVVASLLVVQI